MLHYVICGTSSRGFKYYMKQWCPKIGQRLDCIVGERGAVIVINGKKVQCGTVPTELQEVFKNFLKAGGTITAKVKKDIPVKGEKGPEILCQYILCGPETEWLKNEVKAVQEAVAKMRKQLKNKGIFIRKISDTKDNKMKNLRKRSTDSNIAIDKKFAKKKQTSAAKNSSKNVENNGYRKGPSTSAASSTPLPNGNNRSMEEKIPLTDKHFVKLAQCINKNWQLLGIELGLTNTQIWQIKTDNPGSVEIKIYNMLLKWGQMKAEEMDDACLQYFEKALAECPKVGVEQPQLDNAILKIKEDFKAKRQKQN